MRSKRITLAFIIAFVLVLRLPMIAMATEKIGVEISASSFSFDVTENVESRGTITENTYVNDGNINVTNDDDATGLEVITTAIFGLDNDFEISTGDINVTRNGSENTKADVTGVYIGSWYIPESDKTTNVTVGNISAKSDVDKDMVYGIKNMSVFSGTNTLVNGDIIAEGSTSRGIFTFAQEADISTVVDGKVEAVSEDGTGMGLFVSSYKDSTVNVVITDSLKGSTADIMVEDHSDIDGLNIVVYQMEKDDSNHYVMLYHEDFYTGEEWKGYDQDAENAVLEKVSYIIKENGGQDGCFTTTGDGSGVVEVNGKTYQTGKEGNVTISVNDNVYKLKVVTGGTKEILKYNGDGTYTLTIPRGGGVTLEAILKAIGEKKSHIPVAQKWDKTSGNWEYYKSNGAKANNEWVQIDVNGVTRWYHFGADSKMDTGWFRDSQGKWFYLCSDADMNMGAMHTGWLKDPNYGYTYYFDPVTGVMATGWTTIDGKQYYFAESSTSEQGRLQNER